MDLASSAPQWPGWYRGVSKEFAQLGVPRILVVTDVDHLDRDLTVGQMTGAFGVEIVPSAGHCINEDAPAELAGIVASLAARLDWATRNS